VLAAAQFAAHKHRDQRRKGADQRPYINHPIDVASTLATVGGVEDAEVLMAALLHDTVEDTDCTPEEIEEHFGADVRALVEEMTDDKALENAERKQRQVEHAPHLTPRAKLIKLGDKICNVRDITRNPPVSWSLERRRRYFDWTARVVAGVRGTSAPLEALYDDVLAAGYQVLEGLEALES
jgi:(p)ppGpp synthase/HD superfamily hydrolase